MSLWSNLNIQGGYFMKQIVIGMIGLILLNGASAQAALWVVTSTTHESATTPAGINTILNKYKDLFTMDRAEATNAILAGISVNKISSIEIHAEGLKWVGPTVCQADDSRLKDARVIAKVLSTNGEGTRFHEPSDEDPCL